MGLRLNLIIGAIAISIIGGCFWYIDYLQDQIATLKGNQITLQNEIKTQNEQIKNMTVSYTHLTLPPPPYV